MSADADVFSFTSDSAEEAAFRAEVRAWIDANAPRELCHRAHRVEPAELRPWHRKLYERGWIAPHWPKEAGGMGATLAQQVILLEEMVRIGAPTPYPHGLNFIGPTLIEVGTPEQKARHLPGILTGDVTWCQGYSEPGAGSDLASLRTRAVLDGDHFVVNGHKCWTTNGHYADWMFALVRTDPDAPKKQQGLSMLLIDLRTPGITIRPIRTIVGDSEFAEEFFDDVRVPRENLLGPLHEGWKVANLVLGNERFATGTPRMAADLIEQAKRLGRATGRDGRSRLPRPARRARHRPYGVRRLLPARRAASRRRAHRAAGEFGDESDGRRACAARGGAPRRGGRRAWRARRPARHSGRACPPDGADLRVASHVGRQRHVGDSTSHPRPPRARPAGMRALELDGAKPILRMSSGV